MKNKRQELIDFYEWMHPDNYRVNPKFIEMSVETYLESINSASDESQSIQHNEQTDELCIHPVSMFYNSCSLYATDFCYNECAYSNAKRKDRPSRHCAERLGCMA